MAIGRSSISQQIKKPNTKKIKKERLKRNEYIRYI